VRFPALRRRGTAGGLERESIAQGVRACLDQHLVQLLQRGSARGSGTGVETVQRPSQRAAPSVGHLADDPTSSARQLERDGTPIVGIHRTHKVTRGMQAISQSGDRRADHSQCLGALRRARPAPALEQQQQSILREGHLELVDAAQREADKIPSRDLESRQLLG